MKVQPILCTDFYKVHHKHQYHPDTSKIYSNFTPRSNRLAPMSMGQQLNKVVVFGLQGFIKRFLIETFNEEFFSKPLEPILEQYKRITGLDTYHIKQLHDLGFLPLCIKAIPEGEMIPMKVPMFTITNTIPEFYWLVNYLETVLSDELWKPATVATIAFAYRNLLEHYAETTGSPKDFVLWQGHDFSMRGMSGYTDAAAAGAGHLLSFTGTDTIPAISYVEQYYHGLETFVAGSVPASEHSTASANILIREQKGMTKAEAEQDFLKHYITKLYPTGIASYVSDTYDFFRVINEIAPALKTEIESREPDQFGNAKVVFRPDSGDPVKILCGYSYYEGSDYVDFEQNCYDAYEYGDNILKYKNEYFELEHVQEYNYGDYDYGHSEVIRKIPEYEILGAVEILWKHFGGTFTSTGHKLLNPRVGIIYGDSITLDRAEQILSRLKNKGFASANVVFGIGSYTYQYLTRDTFGFAMKATFTRVLDREAHKVLNIDLYKDPATDTGTKKSAKGLLRVEKEDSGYVLYDQQDPELETTGELRTVFLDGKLIVDDSLEVIRGRLNKYLEG